MSRITKEEAAQKLIKEVINAVYPILIPVEEQSFQIQEQNYAMVEALATEMVHSFMGQKHEV